MTETALVQKKGTRTTAVVAIAAGAVLLLGGGTTLAYWSTQASITAGTVTSGDLNITVATEDVEWTVTPEGAGGVAIPADIDTLRIVPGDTVTMTQTATLTLVGDNLNADLDAVLVGATLPAGVVAPVPAITISSSEDADALTAASNNATVTVTLSYVFPNTTEDRDLTNAALNFGGVDLTLTQVAP